MAANNPLFDFSQPRVMAILNVTPDSFFAGSRMPDAPHVERRVREAVEAGTISKTRYASYLAMYEEANARKEWEK